jgi:hypothetical protein
MANATLSADARHVLEYLGRSKYNRDRTRTNLREACQLGDRTTAERVFNELLAAHLVTVVDDMLQLTAQGKQRVEALRAAARPTSQTVINEMKNSTVVVTDQHQGLSRAANDDTTVSLPKPKARQENVITFDPFATPTALPGVHSRRTSVVPGAGPTSSELTGHFEGIPMPESHSLRFTRNLFPAASEREEAAHEARRVKGVRFMLAFESPAYSLPIPVLDGDFIGKSDQADIRFVHDQSISRLHCRFTYRQRGARYDLYICDMSTNGTCVNGKRLEPHKERKLQHGSRITINFLTLIVVEIP